MMEERGAVGVDELQKRIEAEIKEAVVRGRRTHLESRAEWIITLVRIAVTAQIDAMEADPKEAKANSLDWALGFASARLDAFRLARGLTAPPAPSSAVFPVGVE